MDTITVVLQLTGLLLLTPAGAADARPTHVLMPATGNGLSVHFPEIGYRPSGTSCQTPFLYKDGACFLSMDGWAVEIGDSQGATPTVSIPSDAMNVSNVAGLKIPPEMLRDTADLTLVRSRMTLHAGVVTDTCALARWRFGNVSYNLPNVMEWTVPNVAAENGRVKLVRHSLGQPGVSDTITLPRATNDTLELLVLHLRAGELKGEAHAATEQNPGKHFRAYYRLLRDPEHGTRPVPSVEFQSPTLCELSKRRQQLGVLPHGQQAGMAPRALMVGPGTLACMIATGTSGP